MKRKKLSKEQEVKILVLSRRRCCLCSGLNRDLQIKQGQIAHLDSNPENDNFDNLAFLCLSHHDSFDSTTSQSKGLIAEEVKIYRKELYEIIDQVWKQPLKIGDSNFYPFDEIAGHYIKEDDYESAEIEVINLPNEKLKIIGFALYGKNFPGGPNIGELDFVTNIEKKVDGESVCSFQDNSYKLKLIFNRTGLTAVEEHMPGYFGINVSFGGDYKKIPSEKLISNFNQEGSFLS